MRRWIILLLLLSPLVGHAQDFSALSQLSTLGLLNTSTPINRAHPFAQGLVSAWRVLPGLDGGSKVYDLLGQQHGTLTSMPSGPGYATTFRPGGFGEVRFDGTGYIDVGLGTGGIFDFTGNGTLALWINPLDGGGGGFGRILDKRGSTSTGWALIQNDATLAGAVGFGVNANGTYGQDFASTIAGVVPLNTWTHVVVTIVASSTVTFYINGRVVAQDTGSGSLNQVPAISAVALQFGAAPGRTDRNFHGAMDDIRLYQRVLTPSEIFQGYLLARQGDPGFLNTLPLLGSLGAGSTGSFAPFFQ